MEVVVLRIPGKDEEGYLGRMMALAEVQDAIRADEREHGDLTANGLRKMIDFLLPFVECDGDPEEALMSLSENEYNAAMNAFKSNPVPKETSEHSPEPSLETQA